MISSPGSPFINTRVEDVDKRLHRMLHQRQPKPRLRKTSNKKGHETKSKALEISSLRRM
uniref:Uncharacterized protein n=1 Tax=Arundo donax TaxID=35708 RepID=A0A0A9CGK2_ARUDO